MMAINYQLENFASAPVRPMQQTNVLAVCFADEAAKGSQCYVYSTCKCVLITNMLFVRRTE